MFQWKFLEMKRKNANNIIGTKESTQSDQEFPKIVFHFTVQARLYVVVVAFLTFFASHSVTEFTRMCVSWPAIEKQSENGIAVN